MSGDVIPSPPMSPTLQYDQSSPPTARKRIPPKKQVSSHAHPSSASPPPSAPTRPSQPANHPTTAQAPLTRPPPALRPPPPRATRKSPPAKPKPFVERKADEAVGSPKTVPTRPASRTPPPKAAAMAKKVSRSTLTVRKLKVAINTQILILCELTKWALLSSQEKVAALAITPHEESHNTPANYSEVSTV